MTPVPACTIVSNNYLALARVLAESYVEQHPGARVFVCLVDRPHPDVRYDELPFETLFVEELGIERFASLAFGCGILELNTAVKPFLLEHLRARHGLERVFYLDPDILVLDRLAALEEALERGPMVLTPHVTAPLDDERQPSERLILLSGVYNLGFVGLRLDDTTAPFLRWWQRRLRRFCLHDVEHGLFVDQSWMDLAPALLPDVQIARDPVFNVAYWNLAHRRPALADGRWRIDGRPLGFFHFSGLPFDDLERVSRYQDRIRLSERPELRALFEHYRARVLAAGHTTLRALPYAFGRFDDGRPVPDLARRVLRRVDPEGARWPNPFAAGPDSFVHWLTEPLAFTGGALQRLALSLWEERPELQARFRDVCGADRAAFASYLLDPGDAALPPALLAPSGGAAARTPLPSPPCDALARLDPARPGALLGWLNEPLGPPGARPIVTRFALHVHARRADVRWIYPDPLGRDRRAFAYWFAVIGADEVGAHPALVAPVRRSLPWRSRWSLRVRRLRRARAERRRRALRPPPPAHAVAQAGPPASPRVEVAAPFGVNLVAHFEDDSEVGRAACGTRALLRAAGVAMAELCLDRDPRLDLARGQLHPPQGLPYDVTLLYTAVDETPRVLARLPLAARAGARVAACWFWEIAHFPLRLAECGAGLHEIWAPSRFVERALVTLARVPVRHVPPSWPAAVTVDAAAATRARLGFTHDTCVFTATFDGRAYAASHPEALVDAFARAQARAARPLALLLVARHAHEAQVAHLRQRARGLPVVIEAATGADAAARLAAGDAFVSLHRASALGLDALGALERGQPVIATAYGGPAEWLDERSGYPVTSRRVPLERDEPPLPRGALWAEPDIECAADALCRVAAQPDEALVRAAVGRERAGEQHAAEPAGRHLVDALQRLARIRSA